MSYQHEQLIELLWDVHRSMAKYMKSVLTAHHIPMTMLMMSEQIGTEPGITISELARRTGIAKSHVSNTIRELERQGWVEKRADTADQRCLSVYLSQAALEHVGQVKKSIRHDMKALVSDIPEQLAEELLAGLMDIKLALERVQDPGDCSGRQATKEIKADD